MVGWRTRVDEFGFFLIFGFELCFELSKFVTSFWSTFNPFSSASSTSSVTSCVKLLESP